LSEDDPALITPINGSPTPSVTSHSDAEYPVKPGNCRLKNLLRCVPSA
jgi:hypothetical protein